MLLGQCVCIQENSKSYAQMWQIFLWLDMVHEEKRLDFGGKVDLSV